ncbi:MAG TPA: ABC transporter substrate-binding protein [Thermoplasmata archaeon]|nr:ABC transporter substrate-binding protein [Thermoplasmata archaeon]
MAAGGGAPPAEAMRGAKGVSVVIVAIVAIVLFGAGIGVGWVVFSPAPAKVSKLFLGTNTPFPPFEFRNATTDALQGFDIELIQTIVHRGWGYNACSDTVTNNCYEWNDFRDFSALLAAVSVGRMDIAVGAITENGATGAERNKSMDFSNPYYVSNQGILKRANDNRAYCAAAICTVAELNSTTLKIGAQAITTSEFWVEANLPAVTANNHLQLRPTVEDTLLLLSQSVVDIVVIDLPAAQGIAAANPTAYAVGGEIQTNELYGFAVANGDPLGLVPIINAQLAAMKSDGTYNTILNKWF